MLIIDHLNTFVCEGNQKLPILSDISLTLNEKQILALVGESGSGKSMLGLSLLNLNAHNIETQGKVFFNGLELTSLNETEFQKIRGKEIGMIFQNPQAAFNPVFTIEQLLLESLFAHEKIPLKQAKHKVLETLSAVELSNPKQLCHKFPHELSGGMLQRVMIASALICEPKLLIADEPTTALDLTTQYEVLKLLKTLSQKTKMGVLLISHDLTSVAQIADDICVMYAGQIVETATVKNLLSFPSHPYTESLFKALPSKHIKRGCLYQTKEGIHSFKNAPKGCRFAKRCHCTMQLCQTETPPLFKLESQNTACWLYDPDLEMKLDEKDLIES